MVACVRKGKITPDIREQYLKQIDLNQAYIYK